MTVAAVAADACGVGALCRRALGPRVLLGYPEWRNLALHIAATTTIPPDLLILLAPFTRIGDWRGNVLPIATSFPRSISSRMPISPTWRRGTGSTAPCRNLDLDDPRVQHALRNERRGADGGS